MSAYPHPSNDLGPKLALAFAALIHALPLPGLLGAEVLQTLYGLSALDASSELLLRHRALMFGTLAALLLAAMAQRNWRVPIVILTLLSDLGFLLLTAMAWPVSPALLRIAGFDVLSILALLYLLGRERPR